MKSVFDLAFGSAVAFLGGLAGLLSSLDPARAQAGELLMLQGDGGYEASFFRGLSRGATIDAGEAAWRVAISAKAHPAAREDCDVGGRPINRYPLRIYHSAGAKVLRPAFEGEVSLTADWKHTYCNSAAILFKRSPEPSVVGMRARRAWDAIRIGADSPSFTIDTVWLSDIRDDCIENDSLHGGRVTGSLFDGCFVGISTRPGKSTVLPASPHTITVSGLLLRMAPFLYEGSRVQAMPLKTSDGSPTYAIYDSVITMADAPMLNRNAWRNTWVHVGDCANNLLLLPAAPDPAIDLSLVPACFTVVTGEAAQSKWAALRDNWIRCAAVRRFHDDPPAEPAGCDPTAHGVSDRHAGAGNLRAVAPDRPHHR